MSLSTLAFFAQTLRALKVCVGYATFTLKKLEYLKQACAWIHKKCCVCTVSVSFGDGRQAPGEGGPTLAASCQASCSHGPAPSVAMLSLLQVPGWRLARSVRHVNRGGQHACALKLLPVNRTMFAHYASMMLTTMQLHPTRLETRTQELNMCANLQVIETCGRNKSKGHPRQLR